MSTPIPGADATGANFSHLPPGIQHAGYTTGSGSVPWTAEQFKADPHAIRIDQTPASTIWDATADVQDFENGAVSLDELAPRTKLMKTSFAQGTRPGQREPCVYASASNLTAVCNALIHGGVLSGVGLWVAHYGIGAAEAQAMIDQANGPFPVVGVQYDDTGAGGAYDQDFFSKEWVDTVSGAPHTGQLYWHTVGSTTTLGAIAASRNYKTTESWIREQESLQNTNCERLLTHALVTRGAQWVSKNP